MARLLILSDALSDHSSGADAGTSVLPALALLGTIRNVGYRFIGSSPRPVRTT